MCSGDQRWKRDASLTYRTYHCKFVAGFCSNTENHYLCNSCLHRLTYYWTHWVSCISFLLFHLILVLIYKFNTDKHSPYLLPSIQASYHVYLSWDIWYDAFRHKILRWNVIHWSNIVFCKVARAIHLKLGFREINVRVTHKASTKIPVIPQSHLF